MATAAHRYVGAETPRKEDPELLTGEAKYTDDLAVPGMLWMEVVRSPFAHARINGIDFSRTLAMDGVVAAYSGKDPPAVINAVLDALLPLGVTEMERPATPERVWKAIQSATGGAK